MPNVKVARFADGHVEIISPATAENPEGALEVVVMDSSALPPRKYRREWKLSRGVVVVDASAAQTIDVEEAQKAIVRTDNHKIGAQATALRALVLEMEARGAAVTPEFAALVARLRA